MVAPQATKATKDTMLYEGHARFSRADNPPSNHFSTFSSTRVSGLLNRRHLQSFFQGETMSIKRMHTSSSERIGAMTAGVGDPMNRHHSKP